MSYHRIRNAAVKRCSAKTFEIGCFAKTHCNCSLTKLQYQVANPAKFWNRRCRENSKFRCRRRWKNQCSWKCWRNWRNIHTAASDQERSARLCNKSQSARCRKTESAFSASCNPLNNEVRGGNQRNMWCLRCAHVVPMLCLCCASVQLLLCNFAFRLVE